MPTSRLNPLVFAPRRFRQVLGLALILLLAAGCWPLPADQPAPGAASTPGATPLAPTDRAINIAGGTEDPPTLDPALASDAYSMFVIRQVFGGLVAFDENLNVVPDIAASLPSVSADGKTYTFVLRKGVKFSDGKEVTSADFKYSMERATDPKLAGPHPASSLPAGLFLGDIVGVADKLAGRASEVRGVQVPDPYTLVLTIDAPKAYFLSKLTAGPAFVVQKSNVDEGARWLERPRGTGPFKIENWIHNQQLILVPNPGFYGGAPKIDAINVWMGANASGLLQQYEMGGLNVADVPVDDLDRVTDRNSPMSKELQTVPEMSVTYLGFNLKQRPFDDPKVREALSLVIDRARIARVMFQSRVREAAGFVPEGLAGYTPAEAGTTYDVSKARRLLEESTYKGAQNLPRLRLFTSGDPLGPMLKDVFSSTLGIDLEVHEVEWSDYLDGLDRHEYPMFTLEWGADFPDPESMIGSLFRSGSPENHTGYSNPSVDEALAAASTESDRGKRMATYAAAEQRILEDHPAVPIYHSVRYTLVKPYLKNLKVTPMGILSLKDVVLQEP